MSLPRARIPLRFSDLATFCLDTLGPSHLERDAAAIKEFETAFAARYDRPQGVAFCRARMGFHHLLNSLDLPQGAEVMMTSIHVADFVNMIRLAGFKPVIIDVERQGYNLDFADLERKITPNTRVICVTHLAGYATDMAKLMDIAEAHDLTVLEDCSQAYSAKYDGQRLGTFGRAAFFSMSLLKSVCTLNGGMVISNDQALLDRLREKALEAKAPNRLELLSEAIRNIIFKMVLGRLLFSLIVFPALKLTSSASAYLAGKQKTNRTVELRNALPSEFLRRLSGAQARLGLKQLKTLDAREQRRAKNGRRLYDHLSTRLPGLLPQEQANSETVFWQFPVLAEDPAKLSEQLRDDGIDSSPMLLSNLSAEPAFEGLVQACDNAANARAKTLFIPIHEGVTEEDLDNLIAAFDEEKRHGCG